ncbi:MAG TPA: hypothetical protein ENI32_06250 [Candidatus Syntrophoarchaeum butanivorans]|uniref:Uncharacterized protein n=1 Tax=Candidatus Syntropharchaeum butanivorans TaxID=1839936 RepID=A0A1F2P2V4_9EURY|nr:MAG: hypothetical protein SBU_001554 [Candidatus Syntrophoarchaeum butanivorans]HEC57465.1 hypothetical protein [Candidatus Syntrophoarchaeum butanivorans]
MREIDDQRLINELVSLFDSFIDTASFLLGKKEVLNRGASAIKPVLDRFHPPDELGIHDMILSKYTPEDFRVQIKESGLDTSEFEEGRDLMIVDWNAWRVENVSGVERDEGAQW